MKTFATGQRFGRLVIIGPAPSNPKACRSYAWEVQCDCGKRGVVQQGYSLQAGNTSSCGCIRREKTRARALLLFPIHMTEEARALLGKVPDPQIAKLCGVSKQAVHKWRKRLGIPCWRFKGES